jgi:alpha-glucuronidase
MKKQLCSLLVLFSLCICHLQAEDGYRLWLRYDKISDKSLLAAYKTQLSGLLLEGKSPTLAVIKEELINGISGLLDSKFSLIGSIQEHSLIIGTPTGSSRIASLSLPLDKLTTDGFLISTQKISGKNCIVIAANTETGVLYGSFHFLQLLQTHKSIVQLNIISSPKIQYRLLNHWDNMNRTVERGYAGFSIWKWHLLPGYIDQRYKDYARANASIGINGTVVNNVNANVQMFTKDYLIKVAALADVFRPYGIKVFLSAKFSAPIELGKLKTADPFDETVKEWWKKKVDEIYSYIPDFGGFLVKANSEGQPGPQNYKRTHADGANMLADALAPHNGIVMWRAFVYSNETPTDRTKQAYD